jgi:hypothetical protein
MSLSGFSTVSLEAGQVVGGASFLSGFFQQTIGGVSYVHGQIVPGIFSFSGNLVITTPLVTAEPGAITQLLANDGAVTFARSTSSSGVAQVVSAGATLSVTAQTVTQDTSIVLPSGAITFTAQNGIMLGSGSDTSVAGAVTAFFDVVRISPAGSVRLQTAKGNVSVASGAVVDVRGGSIASVNLPYIDLADSDEGGNAGSLTIIAPNGTAQLAGSLLGDAAHGYSGGKAIFDLNTGDASGLLSGVASFTSEQALTLATGDIRIANVTAQDVELSASTGSVTVYGRIDASGPNGGVIRLTAGKSVNLASNSILDAHATNGIGAGGTVFLGIDGNSTGNLNFAAGSVIDVSGNGVNGNEVWFRAPRIGNGGVAILNGGLTIAGADKLVVEAVKVYDISGNPYVDQNLTSTSQAIIDAANYMGNAVAIKASLGSVVNSAVFQLLPGIELRSSGDLALLTNPSKALGNPFAGTGYIYNDGIDLSALRFNGSPAVLTLRAASNLTMNGSLSDGFSAPVTSPDGVIFAIAPLSGGRSWSLRLVAGADLAAADPTALIPVVNLPASTAGNPEPGSLIFAAPYLIDGNGIQVAGVLRTGTGDLELAAGGNIDIQTAFGIYTAGQPSASVPGFTLPTRFFITSATTFTQDSYLGYDPNTGLPYDKEGYPTALYPSYPTGGGNLTVTTHGSLVGATTSSGYAASEPDSYWLWTEPRSSSPTWFINFGTYYQTYLAFFSDSPPGVAAFEGLGALGGGNVKVNVGGDMTNVDVSLPTTGRLSGTAGLVMTGGGNLNLTVGGAINLANLYVGKGTANIQAGDIGSSVDANGNSARVDLLIGDSQFTVDSSRNINAIIGDATRAAIQPDPIQFGAKPPLGLEGFDSTNFSSYDPNGASAPYGFFTTFTANSAVSELAVGGNIKVDGDFVPPVLEVVAPSGSIAGGTIAFSASGFGWLVALPAQTARVDLLAQLNIDSFGVSMTATDLTGQTAFVATPTGYDYAGTLTNPVTILGLDSSGNIQGQPSDLVQFNDPHTVHVYAVKGSLTQVVFGSSERASVRAGLDIVQPIFDIENAAASDISSVQAGRDITSAQPGVILGPDEFNIRVEGPGTIDVEAGRNILVQAGEFGTQGFGVASVGNTDNPIYLPATGASNNIAAGVGGGGPDLTKFINTYIDPAEATSATQIYLGQLTIYMSQQEGTILDAEQALSDFRALSPAQQTPFIEQVYFDEIKAGGESYAKTKVGYDRSYKAIETLFPGTAIGGTTTAYSGSITLYQLARIRSEQGGNINILVPGGGVTLGVENQTPDLTGQTDTARPGVLTLQGGNINIFTDQSVVVAQSRIFTELGGDIAIWSTNGDINAGKGKQTSIVTSPPKILYDSFANVTKTPVTPQTGAGIATLIGVPGVPPGNVDLFAPHGTIDASEAGIRVSGNLTVAALQVLSVANIQVRGTSVGIPTVVTPNIGALTAASNTVGSSVNTVNEIAKQQTTAQQPDIPSVITVEVVGYGG